jgi:hypothetical protein
VPLWGSSATSGGTKASTKRIIIALSAQSKQSVTIWFFARGIYFYAHNPHTDLGRRDEAGPG